MVIAVNTRFWTAGPLEGFGYFTREVFTRMVLAHPENRFYFLFDRQPEGLELPAGAQALVLGPPARHPLLWKYWLDVRVPLALRKIGADVFVSPDGFASLTSSVPQCLVVHDLGFLHQPEAYRKSHLSFYRHYTPRFVRKAAAIATVSSFSKADIVRAYGAPEGKIDVVYSAVKPLFRPLPFSEKEAVREAYTEGQEYFIYIGALQPRKNLVNLLKAFSLFKKRQQSGMKLVLAGRLAWKNNAFLELLSTYKYRADVVLTGYLEEEALARLAASAYALVYPSLFEGFGVPVLEGMQSGVAVLTSGNSPMEEIGGEAALYFNPTDVTDMADKLMRIYKDEELRARLISRGREVAAGYSWERTASLLWQSVLRAAGRAGEGSTG
jgi:glycosyltransferase involved in cell wall biosynthesis